MIHIIFNSMTVGATLLGNMSIVNGASIHSDEIISCSESIFCGCTVSVQYVISCFHILLVLVNCCLNVKNMQVYRLFWTETLYKEGTWWNEWSSGLNVGEFGRNTYNLYALKVTAWCTPFVFARVTSSWPFRRYRWIKWQLRSINFIQPTDRGPTHEMHYICVVPVFHFMVSREKSPVMGAVSVHVSLMIQLQTLTLKELIDIFSRK